MRPLSLVKYQPERSRAYLGSPSVVRLPDGALIVTHDYYGTGCPRNHESEESLTSVYRSEDDGLTWVNITHIMNCYWSTLFLHEGALWILGTSQQYGSIYIRRSDDGGFTWTHPVDEKTGILFRGRLLSRRPELSLRAGCRDRAWRPHLEGLRRLHALRLGHGLPGLRDLGAGWCRSP